MRRLIGIGVAVLLAGCGAAVTHTSTTHTATQPVRPTTHAQTVTPKPPVRVALIGTHPYPFSGADTTVVPGTYLMTFTSNQQGDEVNPDVGTVTFARPRLYKAFTVSQPTVTLTDPLTAANTRFNPTYAEMFDSPDYYWVTYSHHVWTLVQEVPTTTTPTVTNPGPPVTNPGPPCAFDCPRSYPLAAYAVAQAYSAVQSNVPQLVYMQRNGMMQYVWSCPIVLDQTPTGPLPAPHQYSLVTQGGNLRCALLESSDQQGNQVTATPSNSCSAGQVPEPVINGTDASAIVGYECETTASGKR